jgi:hypothetical protein
MSISDFICVPIDPSDDPFMLTLPGGIEIEHINLLEIVQPALTPLVPLFNIIDTIVALFNCLKAIPDALGLPPDPTALTACLPELSKKISELLRLLPQLSLPYMLRQLLELVIDTLRKARNELIHLQKQMQQILRAIDKATNLDDAGLLAITVCAQANVAQEAANVGKMLASLGKLIGLINLFLGMVGLPEVPNLSKLAGQPLDGVIEPLDDLMKVLVTAKKAIPLP